MNQRVVQQKRVVIPNETRIPNRRVREERQENQRCGRKQKFAIKKRGPLVTNGGLEHKHDLRERRGRVEPVVSSAEQKSKAQFTWELRNWFSDVASR